MRHHLAAILLSLALAACAQGPYEQWSLRSALTGAPPLPPDPAIAAADARAQAAYQADATRLQAGLPAIEVSQVTISGGEIRVPVGGGFKMSSDWRQHGVVTVTVAECEVVPVPLQRVDKVSATTVYATRVQGIVSIGAFPAAPCSIPAGAQSFPSRGAYPLHIRDRVRFASVHIDAWGSPPAPYPPSYGSFYDHPYGQHPYASPTYPAPPPYYPKRPGDRRHSHRFWGR